jgi:hypothetical protein
MNDERSTSPLRGVTPLPIATGALTEDERWRLTLYKWRYSLESQGFTPAQARQLLFVKWLYNRRLALP